MVEALLDDDAAAGTPAVGSALRNFSLFGCVAFVFGIGRHHGFPKSALEILRFLLVHLGIACARVERRRFSSRDWGIIVALENEIDRFGF